MCTRALMEMVEPTTVSDVINAPQNKRIDKAMMIILSHLRAGKPATRVSIYCRSLLLFLRSDSVDYLFRYTNEYNRTKSAHRVRECEVYFLRPTNLRSGFLKNCPRPQVLRPHILFCLAPPIDQSGFSI